MSLVDELDVAGRDPGFLDRYGACVRRLTGSRRPLLTPAVYDEARRVLG